MPVTVATNNDLQEAVALITQHVTASIDSLRTELTSKPGRDATLLTAKEFGEAIRKSEWTVRRMIESGELSVIQKVKGGRIRIPVSEVERLNAEAAPKEPKIEKA